MSILDANGSVACAECGRKARDERDKLLDGFHAMQQLYEDELKHALAENAELRELVKHLNTCNFYTAIECANVHCWECPYDNSTGNCDFDKRMRELRIEVGDGQA